MTPLRRGFSFASYGSLGAVLYRLRRSGRKAGVGTKLSTEFAIPTSVVRLPPRYALSRIIVWVMASFRTQEIFGPGPQT